MNPPALTTALELLARGLWPVPITPPGTPSVELPSPGKQPIGKGWGRFRHSEASLRSMWRKHPEAGVGLKLGKDGGVIDVEIDDPEAAEQTLLDLFGGETVESMGWTSRRGPHVLLAWNERLARWGKTKIELPGVEIRIGALEEGGQQLQSVVPPSPDADGNPRRWNGVTIIAPVPDAMISYLDRVLAPAPRPAIKLPRTNTWSVEDRARAYLAKCEPAVSGQRGHSKIFKAACKIGPGFDLHPDIAFRLIADHYNPTCDPPWSEREIQHKIAEAYKVESNRGWLLERERKHENGHAGEVATAAPNEAAADPHRLARLFLERCYSHHDGRMLHYWLEEWHSWDGEAWRVIGDREIASELVGVIKDEFDRLANETGTTPRPVKTGIVYDVLQALRHVALLSSRTIRKQPSWTHRLPGEELPNPVEILPASNLLVHLPALVEGDHCTLSPTPRFFSPNSLGYSFDPNAPPPVEWLKFLDSLWPGDPESVASLQEWFGYLLTPQTHLQKILMIIGPKRSGKGTIGRILRALVGPENVAAPTLSGLAQNFGLAPLIGKTVALIADARLSGRADGQVIVERLLSISGEDVQTFDRKHLSSWTGTLPTRFVLISNELPRLGDSSGALPSRMILLQLTHSFYGHEDTTLTGRLLAERTSILRWAIDGWASLHARGRFLQASSGRELLEDLDALSSPISAWAEDRLRLDPEAATAIRDLFADWKTWCDESGRDHHGDVQGFSRALRSCLPSLKARQVRVNGKRVREFIGVELAHVPQF